MLLVLQGTDMRKCEQYLDISDICIVLIVAILGLTRYCIYGPVICQKGMISCTNLPANYATAQT